jgi:hypothetical protein
VTLSTLEERAEYRLGHLGSVLAVVWHEAPTVDCLEVLERHHLTLAQRFGKVTLLSVIVTATRSPSPDVRAKIDEQASRLQAVRHGSVVVVLAKGLAAIFIRTYLAALSLVTKEPLRVVKTLADAATEIGKLPGQDEATRQRGDLEEHLMAFVALPAPRPGG